MNEVILKDRTLACKLKLCNAPAWKTSKRPRRQLFRGAQVRSFTPETAHMALTIATAGNGGQMMSEVGKCLRVTLRPGALLATIPSADSCLTAFHCEGD